MQQNTTPQPPIDPSWMKYARARIGTREIKGDLDNPFIVECLRDAGLPENMLHDETAWCGSLCNKCLKENGIKGPKGPAKARNWFGYGQRLAWPVHGCIMVFSRPPDPDHGHVGFYDARTLHAINWAFYDILGGNQNNTLMVKPYPKERFLGAFWPPGQELPPGAQVYTDAEVLV